MKIIIRTSKEIKQFFLILITALFLISCADFQKYIDKTGIETSCREIIKGYRTVDPSGLSLFISRFSLTHSTAPFDTGLPDVKPIGDWKLDVSGNPGLIQEKLFFKTPLSELTHSDDRLVLYIYRNRENKNRPVLLFVPGMGVSNLALFFIKNFFTEIIRRGYTLAVYIPPYHLDRIPEGGRSGEGFFSYDTVRNIRMVTGCASELRSVIRYFKSNGISDISAWGGSMGASFLMLTADSEYYSHLTLMIPVLDWNSLLLDSEEACELKNRQVHDGFTVTELRRGYDLISPMSYNVLTPPDRILIMFARYDQLTPAALLERYRIIHKNPLIKIYNRSHSTILTDYSIYSDYALQLDKWDSGKN